MNGNPGPDDDGVEDDDGFVDERNFDYDGFGFTGINPIVRQPAPLVNQETTVQTPLKSDTEDQSRQSITKTGSDEINTKTTTSIRNLPEPYRTAVRLHYLENISYPDIARQLNLPIGTVKSHVSRGVKILKSLLSNTGKAQRNQLSAKEARMQLQAGIPIYL